ncbi:MAG: OmpA family protein [Cytophagales bacterium]|nr:OmpA family protein [Cytophagales bacterium]
MKQLIPGLVSLFAAITTLCFGQEESPVTVNGKIIDRLTKDAVTGKIKYESLPYGSKIGVFRGDVFQFNMENGHDYSIAVEAEGYSTYFSTLKVAEALNGTIETVVELVPTGTEQVIRLDRLIFALGKDEITETSHGELDELVNMLKQNTEMIIQLEGHTDFRGNAKQNMRLSERRVVSVKNYLVEKGIPKKRIKTKAFGGTQPLSRANDEESRRKNRRVEARVLSN